MNSVKSTARVNPWDYAEDLSRIPKKDHYSAAKTVIRGDPRAFLAYRPNFALSDRQLYKILLIIAKSEGRLITDHIEAVKNERFRFKLALEASKNDGPSVAQGFSRYKISRADWVKKVALSAIQQNPRSTPKHIQQFPISEENFRFELLKIAVENDSSKALELVKKFAITTPEFIYEIAKIKASKDPWNFIFEISKWSIPQESWREELAIIVSLGRYQKNVSENIGEFHLSGSAIARINNLLPI